MTKRPDAGESKRIILVGRPATQFCDNRVSTSKYSLLNFFPIAIREQFRRNGNVYFLCIGLLMALGYYTNVFETAISPWTTLGPLAVVVSISLAQEGAADLSRHRSDSRTNNHPCVVLRRADELAQSGGVRDNNVFNEEDVKIRMKADVVNIAFERVKRMDIRTGHLVLVRNRDMVPADLILLASSGDSGNAYIETSSIDGETNLKLRTRPHFPRTMDALESMRNLNLTGEIPEEHTPLFETLEQATKRIAKSTVLGNVHGIGALENPINPKDEEADQVSSSSGLGERRRSNIRSMLRSVSLSSRQRRDSFGDVARGDSSYVTTLTSELPNASVNTYSGKLTIPPIEEGQPSIDVALGVENVLLRGAMLRNTEWVIGMACFTGKDTKLVQNSFQTPSKFSQLDELINRTVFLILTIMALCVLSLGGLSIRAYQNNRDLLWYTGLNTPGEKWPYLPDLDAPEWSTTAPNLGQQVFLFITLLNNFVPLSLYVTVEIVTLAMMIWLNIDIDMYHEETDTPAMARSTTVTDLGMVKYVFSDKTGTLTQNVMRFKRCSVDGMVFGAPIEKARPGAHTEENRANIHEDETSGVPAQSFHPLRQLLLGAISISNEEGDATKDSGLSNYNAPVSTLASGKRLTFNAEMFLRVMSICHTVVVEKDFDDKIEGKDDDTASSKSSWTGLSKIKQKVKKKGGKMFGSEHPSQLEAVKESAETVPSPVKNMKHLVSSMSDDVSSSNHAPSNLASHIDDTYTIGKSPDGAPDGHNYQAESPDEGALVSAASLMYGFQVFSRDSSGIRLACSSPSLLEEESIVDGLKNGTLSPKVLAAQTASPSVEGRGIPPETAADISARSYAAPRMETWAVLAVNKFDSDRKRMSVLVRSPRELGSVPMLLCKGADSSMLDSSVCNGGQNLIPTDNQNAEENGQETMQKDTFLSSVVEDGSEAGTGDKNVFRTRSLEIGTGEKEIREEGDEWEMATMLGIQAHLGDFASEGLRTLVLGVRILGEEECENWLSNYRAAATSIKDREKKLTDVALAIERDLHIVGVTAIEDQLQDGVPDTIATLESAGIKLWVLTGDKRETAIEIGYSTKVLTPKMHVAQIADGPVARVRTLMAMEFIRLVKFGKLPEYQRASLGAPNKNPVSLLKWKHIIGVFLNFFFNALLRIRLVWACLWATVKNFVCCGRLDQSAFKNRKKKILMKLNDPVKRRKNVRDLADKVIHDFLASEEGRSQRRQHAERVTEETNFRRDAIQRVNSADSDSVPAVFNRASSARALLDSQRQIGRLTGPALRTLSIASETSKAVLGAHPGVIDEDVLSLASFLPGGGADVQSTFDKKKRTLLEKLFAVDRSVRHGKLRKHLVDEKLSQLATPVTKPHPTEDHTGGDPRALVIEGAALAHFLGDPQYEEMLFAVASSCDSVIACRVSPKQKALMVRMVRKYVEPTPVTLAIGDGANDVGMIQEAHVGVGISGLEGQQAVNASDFAIAQFRFLRELLLIHGRWNFIRMCKVVLFSFYKNAVLAGVLIIFGRDCLYSGTPLYDQWVISMFNFVANFPIFFTGLFDRDLEKDYVKRNPTVYASGPNNENITLRITIRWLFITIIHVLTIYLLSIPVYADGGGITSAFTGLMANNDPLRPGDGEGGDLNVVGTAVYTSMIVALAWKILYESRSIIHGEWPAFTCQKGVGEGWPSRLAYTWIGVFWLSIGFYIWAIYIYSLVGRSGASTFSSFVMTGYHLFNTRSITWMSIVLVSITACVFDVTGKLFANMYFPTQTQIHMEIQAKERWYANKEGDERQHIRSLPLYEDGA